ncbi:MAG: tetratricopeptide repeat protein [Thiohalocapsa sp.]|jgi:Flp pilus assembly protein TadD|nr:tetratricopeptide repeat protein [Thiohalocapsa sp.]
MFPRLTPLQWVVFLLFVFFYGFTVFAVTRDYYQRNPPRAAAQTAAGVSAGDASALGGRMREALSDTESSLPEDLLNANPTLISQEADRLFAERRFAQAATLYRRLIELDPADVGARNDLGLALHYAGRTPEALSMLREGADMDPDFQRIWLSLGFVAVQADATEQARAALIHARDLDPETDIGKEASRLLDLL